MVLLDKGADPDAREWYASAAVEHGWSRKVLEARSPAIFTAGRAPPSPASITPCRHRTPSSSVTRSRTRTTSSSSAFRPKAKERDLEAALLNDVQSFLMEMGRGFALVGRQFR